MALEKLNQHLTNPTTNPASRAAAFFRGYTLCREHRAHRLVGRLDGTIMDSLRTKLMHLPDEPSSTPATAPSLRSGNERQLNPFLQRE